MHRMYGSRLAFLGLVLGTLAGACSATEPGGVPAIDAPAVGGDLDARVADARGVSRPTWRLEDIQPLSPRVGQTYGLDAYTDHTVVVTLVEGF